MLTYSVNIQKGDNILIEILGEEGVSIGKELIRQAEKYMGTFNIPDGEVASAPVKTSINGYITYNIETTYNGITFNNIRFEFKDGKIINATANKTKELNEILDTDEGARYGEIRRCVF